MNSDFKVIFNEKQQRDKSLIKEYLYWSFKKRKTKKCLKFYKNILNLNKNYPKTFYLILVNIPKLGYYKDYFWLLYHSNNNKIDQMIYNIIVKQLKRDMYGLKSNRHISTLGKWLPRENHKINKKKAVVDTISKRLFGSDIEINTLRKKYRILKSRINDKLGTLEKKMATKKYNYIDYELVSTNSLKKNTENLRKREECVKQLNYNLEIRARNLSIDKVVHDVINGDDDMEILNSVFNREFYIAQFMELKKVMWSSSIVIDLSKEIFDSKSKELVIGLALLINKYSKNEKKVFVNYEHVVLDGKLKDNVDTLLGNCGLKKTIELEKYDNLIDTDYLIVMTRQKINPNSSNKNIIHVVPYGNQYDMIKYYNDKTIDYVNITDKIQKSKNEQLLDDILKRTGELESNNYVYTFIVMIVLLFGIKMLQ